jgi:hypothetical protein
MTERWSQRPKPDLGSPACASTEQLKPFNQLFNIVNLSPCKWPKCYDMRLCRGCLDVYPKSSTLYFAIYPPPFRMRPS